MKKLLMALIVLFFLTMPAQAENWPFIRNAKPFTTLQTLITATTTTVVTGAGIPIDIPMNDYTCLITWGGTIPTNTTVHVEGSVDGSTYKILRTEVVVTSPYLFSTLTSTMPSVPYIRGSQSARTGGSGTSTTAMQCMGISH